MSIRNLKAHYGKPNAKGRAIVNHAIRAEMVGGDDLLDALDKTDRLVQRLRERGLAGVEAAQAAHDRLCELRDLFAEIVLDRYAE